MDGLGGLEGWRWIFIIEGILTIAMAVACFFLLVDSPALSSRWLDPDEIRYFELRQYARRIHSVQASGRKKAVHWDALWAVLTDWKIYLLIVANWSNVVPNYALKFTMPQIIKNMGYTSATAQLLTIPPYAVGALAAYVSSVFADRYSWRMPFIVGPQLCLVVAFSILFTKSEHIKDNVAVCYFAVCLACSGMYPILPGLNAWNISNLAGPEKRSIGIGWLICAGNVGGVIGSYIYIDDEAPKYPTGYGTSFGFAAAGIVACFALEFALWTINKKNSRHTEEQIRAQYSDEELEKMGDRSPLFRYTL
ncbi:putative transporter [Lasiodiplodia hormozganensis]|uniref:Transporter n=1 Tax=Lasiodiplodia hormozganensis TaxID=869390 RepID=A0AA39WV84_9PEZI|nr:putative transporter [Lasiodiplodia hormozganensis]